MAGDRGAGARLYGIAATAAPIVAVIRRGPSDWAHVGRGLRIDVNLAGRSFEPALDAITRTEPDANGDRTGGTGAAAGTTPEDQDRRLTTGARRLSRSART